MNNVTIISKTIKQAPPKATPITPAISVPMVKYPIRPPPIQNKAKI